MMGNKISLQRTWGATLLIGLLTLAGCTSGVMTGGGPSGPVNAGPPQVLKQDATSPANLAGQKVRVALLVPLSGKAAKTGETLMQAAQMAAFDHAKSGFELLIKDTGDTPEMAAAAAKAALDANARLILGPLFATSVPAVRDVAQTKGVPVVTFSNDTTVAGSGVYVMGFAPGEQVRRIVAFADSKGKHRLLALIPQTPYGEAVLQNLPSGTTTHVERYNPGAIDLTSVVKNVVAQKDTFDGILIADSGNGLRQLTGLLSYYDIDSRHTQFLGTGLWDDDQAMGDSSLEGAWFASASSPQRTDFYNRFQALYNQKPPRLATLAYDATALAAILARTYGPYLDASALTTPGGFMGVDGIFRFHSDGIIERGLAVLEIKQQELKVIDPAPTRF